MKDRIEKRKEVYPARAGFVRFSILTTVYVKTDADLFLQTAENLLSQTYPFSEWVILAHGPVSDELDAVIQGLELDARIVVHRLPENLGIMGGMKYCLDRASHLYILPMDADDLLTPDALQILACTIEKQKLPAYLYSDEDHLIEGRPKAPYFRPDWDPVLNLANSYIWHLVCFRRDVALALKFYSDPGAEFCHDWDTVLRVSEAGYLPFHVPEILYHWRQHPASTSNKPEPDGGSQQSTKSLLENKIARLPVPSLYFVEPFPVFRGAPEWHIARHPKDAPPVTLITLNGEAQGRDIASRFPFVETQNIDGLLPQNPIQAKAFLPVLETVSTPFVFVISNNVSPLGQDWFWESLKLLELHADVSLVQGLIVDKHKTVKRGGEIYLPDGELICPQFGKKATDPGAFALALKPHCISIVTTDFFCVRIDFLKQAIAEMAESPMDGFGKKLGQYAQSKNVRVAFSPLILAEKKGALMDTEENLKPSFFDKFRISKTRSNKVQFPLRSVGSLIENSKSFSA